MGAESARPAETSTMHSSVNWALLGLVIERPSYAYELARRFERVYQGSIVLSAVSHAYTALANLRDRGLIEEVPSAGRETRAKRRYRASELGHEEHAAWMVRHVADERRRQQVLSAQLGALARTPERALAALDAYERACIEEMAGAQPPDADEGPGTTRLVKRLISEEARLTLAARLRWAQYARAQIVALAGLTDRERINARG